LGELMRIILLFIASLSIINANINPIKNLKYFEPKQKISDVYVVYVGESLKNKILIKKKNEEFKISNDDKLNKITVYEDNGSFMIPAGNFTIKTYGTAKNYKTKEKMAEILGFEKCDTYNREEYKCHSSSDEQYKNIILRRTEIEKMHNIRIDIEYIYLFK